MNQTTLSQSGSGSFNLGPDDAVFIILRHKVKIILFTMLGLLAGGFTYFFWPNEYHSKANLLIRYVAEERDIVGPEQDTRVTNVGDRGGEQVLGTEIAIITSLDLAKRVAEKLEDVQVTSNPSFWQNVLLKTGFEEFPQNDIQLDSNANRSTGIPDPSILNAGIFAETLGRGSSIVQVSFTNSNSDVVQQILKEYIETYLEAHLDIHQSTDGVYDEYLTKQTDKLKARLHDTETELLELMKKAGVFDLAASRESLASEMNKMNSLIRDTEIELSVLKGSLKKFGESIAENGENETAENSLDAEVVEKVIEDYENTRTVIGVLKSREQELLLRYTEENPLVAGIRNQLKESGAKLKKFESEYPQLVGTDVGGQGELLSPSDALRAQTVRLEAYETRREALYEQLEKLEGEARRIEQIQITAGELERRRALEASNYQNFLTSLENARIREASSVGKINNIVEIESPTPPLPVVNDKIMFAGGILAGLASIGLVWAFAVELLFDNSIKRPVEVTKNTGIPVFLTLPHTKSKTFKRLLKSSKNYSRQMKGKLKAAELRAAKSDLPKSNTLRAAVKSDPEYYGVVGEHKEASNGELAPWDSSHPLSNYFDALRDRVMGYFESKNLQHKPKLIGFSGLGENPGVTTIASGVASSLSKTEGGNVLYVDMTLGQESAQEFYKGENVSTLEEALNTPDVAKREDNLYVVAEGTNGYKLPSLLPSRFNSIIPKLMASDFDYIVFDLPAVSPISSTPRLASFMDIMLLVMESEKTDRGVASQAVDLLSDSKAHLGAVLNKSRIRSSKQLQEEFAGLS